MTTDQKLEYALQALRDVVSPMGKYQRELPENCTLDGAGCVNLLNSVSSYTSIAANAFRELMDMICAERAWTDGWTSKDRYSISIYDEGGVAIGCGRTR